MNGDFVTFTPPLSSDTGSYWCRNRTNHSDIAEGILLFKSGHNYYQSRIATYYSMSLCTIEVLSLIMIGYSILQFSHIRKLVYYICGAIELDSIVVFS